jgi:hypothetical protein
VRRFDKSKQIKKANILLEQRYLKNNRFDDEDYKSDYDKAEDSAYDAESDWHMSDRRYDGNDSGQDAEDEYLVDDLGLDPFELDFRHDLIHKKYAAKQKALSSSPKYRDTIKSVVREFLKEHIVESRASEQQTMNILNKGGVESPEDVLSSFKSGDKSENQKNLPIMGYLYALGGNDIKNIVDVVNEYNELVKKNRVKPAQPTKKGLVIGDKVFNDFLKFSEYIHGETNKYTKGDTKGSSTSGDFKSEKKPLWSGNNIDIYEGDNVGKCINYTGGALTGRAYSFCIGQPGNTMYKSYRDSKTSTFYFIVDRNKFITNEDGSVNLDDPLHIVVFDVTNRGVELTDANNDTGTIAEYGKDVDGYIDYLKSMGVPVDKMVNKPKTDQERKEDELLGRPNNDLEWFKKLPIEYKSAYIGRGHALTNDQFDYLIGDN